MRANLATALLALAILVPAVGCDSTESGDTETRAVENFVDGMDCDSDDGAFRVTLWSDSGDIQVGRNDLVMRLGFHDPNDASAPGKGIPNARIDVDAWMPGADQAMASEPVVTYLGDGEYRIENVVLGEDGVWNFDFAVAVGEHMRESVSLAFEVE
ncbi:FixH family protein [Nannocystaceae bacterium ST9]